MFRFALIAAAAVMAVACQPQAADPSADQRRPQQVGQAVNPYVTAGHIAGARVALLGGDQKAAQKHVEAMAPDRQLPEGQGAFMQAKRKVDVVDPEVREEQVKLIPWSFEQVQEAPCVIVSRHRDGENFGHGCDFPQCGLSESRRFGV